MEFINVVNDFTQVVPPCLRNHNRFECSRAYPEKPVERGGKMGGKTDATIRAIIPQMAMSGGTMIACACKKIVMGKQSCIGPIDPQFNGIPAHGVIAEFEGAIQAVKNDPASLPIWRILIEKYHPTFIGECYNAIDLATQIVTNWLKTGMFNGISDADAKARIIVAKLNNHVDTKTHSRHIPIDDAKSFGLNIINLEDDGVFQDIVLTVHHAYMHAFSISTAIKITENHIGNALVYTVAKAKA